MPLDIAAAGVPLVFLLAGLSGLSSKTKRSYVPLTLPYAGIVAFVIALGVAILAAVEALGGTERAVIDAANPILLVDVVSISMVLLVSFIGAIVLRYARTYLDGEARQDQFLGWISMTLAAVTFLVMSGNTIQFLIAWILTSLSLHKLLLFYPERMAAQRAARKKYILARTGDLALLFAVVLLWGAYNSIDIATITELARAGEGGRPAAFAAIMLAIAALLKSGQFPTHSWLTEIMDTPTPTSALLHAGVINGGGFLLIRFADVLLQSPGTMAVIAMVGGFTALFGSIVMLTQPAVKTSLAWSTVAQMGFLIMQCGLGLFSLAMLHIVAHSLYKAHAFLASGGAVQRIATIRRPGPVAIPNVRTVLLSFFVALGIYSALSIVFGVTAESPQSVALGAILIFGVAYLLTQGMAADAPKPLARQLIITSVITSLSYFLLHKGAMWLTAGTLPEAPAPGGLEWALILIAVASFGAVAFAQALFPLWAYHPAAGGFRVHVSNGFYINALFARAIGSWKAASPVSNERVSS